MALVCFVGSFWLWNILRAEKANDADLRQLPDISAEKQKRFEELTALGEEVHWPAGQFREIQKLLDEPGNNPDLRHELISKNTDVMERFDRLLAEGGMQASVSPDPTAPDWGHLDGWRNLAHVRTLKVAAAREEGRLEAAVEESLQLVRQGRQLQGLERMDGSHFFTAGAFKRLGLEEVRALTALDGIGADGWRGVLKQLEGLETGRDVYTNAFKGDYVAALAILEAFRSGQVAGTGSKAEQVAISVGSMAVLSVKRTRQEMVAAMRLHLASLSLPYSQMPWDELERESAGESGWAGIVDGNAIGKFLFDLMNLGWNTILKQKCRDEAHEAATQGVVAARSFYEEHGRLPTGWNELVPEYLTAVPNDPFSGEPMRYDREKGLVWSVNHDLTDQGGLSPQETEGPSDIVFRIPFGVKE